MVKFRQVAEIRQNILASRRNPVRGSSEAAYPVESHLDIWRRHSKSVPSIGKLRLNLFMHTRAKPTSELLFDPEIERTARKNKKLKEASASTTRVEEKEVHSEASSSHLSDEEEIFEEEVPHLEEKSMTTIRQLSSTTHGAVAPTCITYPSSATNKEAEFELKSGFLHHLPKFHELNNEDPNNHLKLF
ncbi:hypothetical protein ACLB2K_004610 [Fragaria x ananassa]